MISGHAQRTTRYFSPSTALPDSPLTLPPDKAIAWYDGRAERLANQYETFAAGDVHAWLTDLLPVAPGLILDVGAGSGRDAAWLAAQGHEVLAVEPSGSMRQQGQRLHGDTRIRWLEDRLPALTATLRLGLAADAILLSGVWQHIAPADRPRAFRKLVALLKSGGLLAITLRHGPAEPERDIHPVSLAEIETLARAHGVAVVRTAEAADAMGRADVTWTHVALRLPDDGTGALPLLRHAILNDQKSATYKLGLLRALCRAADGAAGLAQDTGSDEVTVPLGLVALNWLRLYLPLVSADLPQSPANQRQAEGLGFAKAGFRALLVGVVSPLDLRIGAQFRADAADAIHAALREATDTITRMPATYLTYPNGGPILPVTRGRAVPRPAVLVLDAPYLAAFGEMRVPRDLWRAMQRFAAWVEPALMAEWARLMRGYAERQGRVLDEGRIGAAMTWADPVRDVSLPRGIALQALEQGSPVYCVWTGRRLDATVLDIDHCLPWAAWPCGDLWNLLPAHRRVNQHQKRDRLPSAMILARAQDGMLAWWRQAYLSVKGVALPRRFADEAKASLPAITGTTGMPDLDEIHAAIGLQRLRLHQDQQVPEWNG
jgi:SAM-dependent methyltransferase